ncbi:microcompartments protein [Thermincola ferriacetica]|uniref:Microcompartments protein n=1 Tax=Thermincola ferriacetica TaxID=281456 RepID=A0A0L6W0I4_9FIRM|nr:BMC domain-containing protein [Thermincola ferriacetica]KNZ68966.1 microcompartments protein [Thermincola ferriacetica]
MKAAIGLLEMKSIARGITAADEMVKAADVKLLQAMPVCPGKFIALVAGDVGAVQSSIKAGMARAADQVIDTLILPNVHRSVFPALSGTNAIEKIRSLGIVETYSVASAITAADVAAKAASVDLLEVRLARGLGGKSFFLLSGEVSAIKSSINAAVQKLREDGFYAGAEFIAAPHKDLLAALN